MPSSVKYYLESSVVIEIITRAKSDPLNVTMWDLFESASRGDCEIITSAITIAECVMGSHETQTRFDQDVEDKINHLWHPQSSPIQIISCHETIVRDAVALFRKQFKAEDWSKARGIDLTHVVTAQREGVSVFITMDAGMDKWAKLLGFTAKTPSQLQAELSSRQGRLFSSVVNNGS